MSVRSQGSASRSEHSQEGISGNAPSMREARRCIRSKPRTTRAALALLAVSIVAASCSASSRGEKAQTPDQGALETALHTWSGFPVAASPRPMILLGPHVIGPAGGFLSSDAKNAFDSGQITPPATWPASPPTADGFAIAGTEAAFKTFVTSVSSPGPSGTPLQTTAVKLGSGLFLTDRGYRRYPAWLFSLSGVQSPVAVLALKPSDLYSEHYVTQPELMSASVGADGKSLRVRFVGGAVGPGPCGATYSLSVEESTHAVAVSVRSHPNPSPTTTASPPAVPIACSAVGYPDSAAAELEAPLGARVVVDGRSKGALVVSDVAPGTPGFGPA